MGSGLELSIIPLLMARLLHIEYPALSIMLPPGGMQELRYSEATRIENISSTSMGHGKIPSEKNRDRPHFSQTPFFPGWARLIRSRPQPKIHDPPNIEYAPADLQIQPHTDIIYGNPEYSWDDYIQS